MVRFYEETGTASINFETVQTHQTSSERERGSFGKIIAIITNLRNICAWETVWNAGEASSQCQIGFIFRVSAQHP